jgi:hypothetical protein
MTVIPIEEMHWTTDGENLSVYKNNDEITDDTTHVWAGNHLLLYYAKMECVFLLEEFFAAANQGPQQLSIIAEKGEAVAVVEGKSITIYENNEVVTEDLIRDPVGDIAVVYAMANDTSYWIEDVSEIVDNQPFIVEAIDTDNHFIYHREDGLYTIFLRGESIALNCLISRFDKGLLVYDSTSKQTFLIPSEDDIEDNVFYWNAMNILGPNEPFWYRTDGDSYRTFVDGEDSPESYETFSYGDAILEINSENERGYVLANYAQAQPYEIYPMIDMAGIYFFAKIGNSYDIYRGWENVTDEFRVLSWSPDVLVYNTEDNIYYSFGIDPDADGVIDFTPEPIAREAMYKIVEGNSGKFKIIVFYRGENISDALQAEALGHNNYRIRALNHNLTFDINRYDSAAEYFTEVPR